MRGPTSTGFGLRWAALIALGAILPACGGGGSSAPAAAPEFRDFSFNPGGIVRLRNLSNPVLAGIALQADGRIVAAGTSTVLGVRVFFVARFTATGVPDATFADGGLRTFSVGSADATAVAVSLLPDGRIVVAGKSSLGFTLCRILADGGDDPALGSGGPVGISLSGSDEAAAMAVQPDGKVVVAGTSANDIAVVRFNEDGSPDATFDGDGRLTTPVGAGNDLGTAVAIQPDGRIVVAGGSHNGTDLDLAVVRYTAAGVPDASFDGDGKLTVPGTTLGSALLLRPDGRIVVVGLGAGDVAVVQRNADGSPDVSFGGTGLVFTPVGALSDFGNAAALQPDGRLVVAAGAVTGGGDTDLALLRYASDGTLDSTFGTGGTLLVPGNGLSLEGRAVAVQPDGRIVAAVNGLPPGAVLYRFSPTGVLDPDFRIIGATTYSLGNSNGDVHTLRVQSTGKILAAITNFNEDFTQSDFSVVRFNVDGSVDETFGTGGIAIVSTSTDIEYIVEMVVQADDRIVVAGYSYDTMGNRTGRLLRLTASGAPDGTFGSGGVAAVTGGTSLLVNAMVLQPDQKIVLGGSIKTGANDDAMVVRLNTDGTVDGTFGMVQEALSFGGSSVLQVAVQPDGKVLAAAFYDGGPALYGTAVLRYTSTGTPDASFGTGGKYSSVSSDIRNSIGLFVGPGGHILSVQPASLPDAVDAYFLRLLPDGTPDVAFGPAGVAHTRLSGINYISAPIVQPDGKLIMSSRIPPQTYGLIRFNTDGSPDGSFGAGGRIPAVFVPGAAEAVHCGLLLPDGKLLIGGFTNTNLKQIPALGRIVP